MTDLNNRQQSDKNRKDRSPKDQLNWKGPGKAAIFWITLFLVVYIIYSYFSSMNQDSADITYTEFITQLNDNNISEVTFEDTKIQGVLKQASKFASSNTRQAVSKFKTQIPFADINYDLVNKLEAKDVKIVAKDQSPNLFSYLAAAAPWIILILIRLFFIRQMQGGGRDSSPLAKAKRSCSLTSGRK